MGVEIDPHDVALEQEVLGCLLTDWREALPALSILTPEDFYEPRHRVIFHELNQMLALGREIDLVTVNERLQQQNKDSLTGGVSYLASLLGLVSSAVLAESHAYVLARKAALRRTIHACQRAVSNCYDERDPEEIIGQLTNELAGNQNLESRLLPMKKIVHEMLQEIEGRITLPIPQGVRCGLTPLDSQLYGLQPGVFIIAGRSHTGKTELALRMAEHISLTDPVIYCELEMEPQQLARRTVFNATGLPHGTIFRPMDHAEHTKFKAGMQKIDEMGGLYILDCPGATLETLLADLISACNRISPKAVFVDYLQLIQASDPKVSEYNHVNFCMGRLKTLSRRLNLPVIVLSQVTKLKGDKRKDDMTTARKIVLLPDDLRGSGKIYEICDYCLFIQSPGRLTEGQQDVEIELMLSKSRGLGGRGCWEYNYHMSTGEFHWLGEKQEEADDDRHDDCAPF